MANLGEIYYKQQQPDDGEAWFEKAIEADPTHAGVGLRQPRRHPYNQGKQTGDKALYKQAISKLRRALAIDADSMSAYSLLALIYYTTAENDQSKLAAGGAGVQAGARDSTTSYPPIYNTLGLIKLRKKNVTGALKEFEQAVELDPKYVEAHLNIGAIGLSSRQYEKAEQSFAAVLKLAAEQRRRDHRPGRGAARPQEVRRGGELVQEGARARPANCAVPYNLGVLYQDYKTDRRPTRTCSDGAEVLQPVPRLRERPTEEGRRTRKRRIKDIDDTFAALEQQKKMEAELKEQQDEMEKQQKEMEEQQKAQEQQAPQQKRGRRARTPAPEAAAGCRSAELAEKPNRSKALLEIV